MCSHKWMMRVRITAGMSGYERMYDGVSRYDKNDKSNIKRRAHAQHPNLLVNPSLTAHDAPCPCPLPLSITPPACLPAPVPYYVTCPFPPCSHSFLWPSSLTFLPPSTPIAPIYISLPLGQPLLRLSLPLALTLHCPCLPSLAISPTPSAPCRHASARPPHQPPVNCI